jgi:hypothetical protein
MDLSRRKNKLNVNFIVRRVRKLKNIENQYHQALDSLPFVQCLKRQPIWTGKMHEFEWVMEAFALI